MRTALVDLDTMQIVTIAPVRQNFGGPWGDSSKFQQVDIPEELTTDLLKAEMVDDEIVISVDSEKTRNMKLAILRELRRQKLLEVDVMVNDLAVGDRTDTTQVREYRQALKDITEDYKYANDDYRGKAALDDFAEDMSDFDWPEKP